jgi:hypothetical protein
MIKCDNSVLINKVVEYVIQDIGYESPVSNPYKSTYPVFLYSLICDLIKIETNRASL